MVSTEQVQNLIDRKATVYAQDGDKIGTVGQVFLDDETNTPNWVTVKTGLFGTSETFVPLDRATVQGDDVHVPYTKDKVKDAPRVDVDQHLSVEEEDELYRYYGLDSGAAYGTAGYDTTTAAGTTRTADYDTTRTADYDATTGVAGTRGAADLDRDRDASVVRSEEQVDIGTRRREAGKARLRKYTVTEHVTKTVPVTREEVRVEREPITGGDTARSAFGDDEAEVTLHEDEVVVDKETVPVERVSLDKDTVTEDRQVTEEVRKERVDTDIDAERNLGPDRDRI